MKHTPGPNEIAAALKYLPDVKRAVFDAAISWIDVPLMVAIASRETWWGYAPGYNPKGTPGGKGDAGHGHGYWQIDDRSFGPWLDKGLWKIPCDCCRKAIDVLVGKRAYITKQGAWGSNLTRASIAAYNCGEGNVVKVYRKGEIDPDERTAGGDYSKDVLALKEFYIKNVLNDKGGR